MDAGQTAATQGSGLTWADYQSVLTLAVAVAAVVVAWVGSSAARQKLRLDLYERRFRLHTDVVKHAKTAMLGPFYPSFTLLADCAVEVLFLFGEDATAKLRTIIAKLHQLEARRAEMIPEFGQPIEPATLADLRAKVTALNLEADRLINAWLLDLLPYMDFHRIGGGSRTGRAAAAWAKRVRNEWADAVKANG